MIRSVTVVVAVWAIATGGCAATRFPPVGPTAISQTGSTRMAASFGAETVTAVLDTEQRETPTPAGTRAKRVFVTFLSIRVGDDDVHVPASAFADIGDPSDASLQFDGRSFTLTITGADGADAYEVRLRFDRTAVRQRLLFPLGEAQASEDTKYRIITVTDRP